MPVNVPLPTGQPFVGQPQGAEQQPGLPVDPAAAQMFSTPPQNDQEFQERKNEILEFLDNPKMQAALTQFGAQLMQPIPFGQSSSGALGQALSSGAEAAGRVATQQQEQERAQQALEIENRQVATQEARTDIQREGLDIQREGLSLDKEFNEAKIRLEGARISQNQDQFERQLQHESEILSKKLATEAGSVKTKLDQDLLTTITAEHIKNSFLNPNGEVDPGAIIEQYRKLRGEISSSQSEYPEFGTVTDDQWAAIAGNADFLKEAKEVYGETEVNAKLEALGLVE